MGLLKLMLEDEDRIDSISMALPGNFFKNPFCRGVYDKILQLKQQGSVHSSVLFDYLEEENQPKLGALLMEPVPGDNLDNIMAGYISAIKRRQRMEQCLELQAALVEAEKTGNFTEEQRILSKLHSLNTLLKGGKSSYEGRPQ